MSLILSVEAGFQVHQVTFWQVLKVFHEFGELLHRGNGWPAG